MKATKSKKWIVKSIPDEDTTLIIDPKSPLNLQQLIIAAKKVNRKKKVLNKAGHTK